MPWLVIAASPCAADLKASCKIWSTCGSRATRRPADERKKSPEAKNALPGGVRVNEVSSRVDQEYACAQAIEHVGEGRRLDHLEIDHLANEHGPTQMRMM